MNKVLKGLVAVAATAAMAVAGFAGASTAMAADTYTVSVDQSDSHTYDAYQVFTGTLAKDGSTLSDLKWGANSKRAEGVNVGDSVDETTVKTLTGVARSRIRKSRMRSTSTLISLAMQLQGESPRILLSSWPLATTCSRM